MASKPYQKFSVPCALSWVTLQQAILQVGPSDVYLLCVNSQYLGYAHDLVVREFTSRLPVVINIDPKKDLEPDEWYVSANGRSYGSEGIS